jgi:hypothetical protein
MRIELAYRGHMGSKFYWADTGELLPAEWSDLGDVSFLAYLLLRACAHMMTKLASASLLLLRLVRMRGHTGLQLSFRCYTYGGAGDAQPTGSPAHLSSKSDALIGEALALPLMTLSKVTW